MASITRNNKDGCHRCTIKDRNLQQKLTIILLSVPAIFTVRKRSCGKVMFSQACVKNSVHRRGCLPKCLLGYTPWADTPPRADTPWADPQGRHPPGQIPPGRHPPQQTSPPSRHPPGQNPTPHPEDGYCCGRYASYWNAFLWISVITRNCSLPDTT